MKAQADKAISRIWSIFVLTLSDQIIQSQQYAFSRIKLRSVNKVIRKIQKFDFQTNKKSSDTRSYVSISDFKPIANLYSSVKIFQQDCDANQFQTRKDRIKQKMEAKVGDCPLEGWMTAKKARVILIEQYPKAEFCSKQILSYNQQALSSIKTFSFQDYCKTALKKHKSTFLFSANNQLKYKKDSISDSLLYLDDTKVQVSIDIFDLLLLAGLEKQPKLPIIWFIWRFIYEVFHEIQDMREEAYLQVIKQLNSTKLIYYQILACLCVSLKPSSRFYLPLLNLLYSLYIDPQYQKFRPYLNFCFFTSIKNFSEPRKAPPSLFELFCIMNLRKIPLLIGFPRENTFFLQAYSTVQQILKQLVGLYGLNQNQDYLFNIEGILLEKGNILDSLNFSRKRQEPDVWAERFFRFQGFRAFIVIKNMMNINKSKQNFLIMYNYIVSQYRKGLFALTNTSIIQIAGLIIASQVQIEECYQFSIAKCLPKKKYDKGLLKSTYEQTENLIIQSYSKFKGTKMQARLRVLEIIKYSKAFLTHFFYCRVFIDDQEYTDSWVGLKIQSLIIVEPTTNRITFNIPYEKIRQWGKSESQLCLKIDQIGELHIQPETLDTLVSIFSSYISYLKVKLTTKDDNQ